MEELVEAGILAGSNEDDKERIDALKTTNTSLTLHVKHLQLKQAMLSHSSDILI